MKFFFLILIIIFVTACSSNKDNSSSSCSPTKSLFSNWTSRTTGNTYFLAGAGFNQSITVQFGPGACSDARGDFVFFALPDNFVGFYDCSDTVLEETAVWDVSCNNVMSLTYTSNGQTEFFD